MVFNEIVFLGTGKNQIPFIQAAKKLNYRVIGIDRDKRAEGRSLCDDFLLQSIQEKEAVFVKLDGRKIVGVLSEQTDNGSATVAFLNGKFRLEGLTENQIETISDKYHQRKFLDKLGILQPRFWLGAEVTKRNKSEKVIVKPRSGQSSIGVHLLTERETVHDSLLCEEYIDGVDFSVDGYVTDTVYFTAWCKKLKYNRSFVDKISFASHHVPKPVKQTTTRILKAINAKNVFFHFEYRQQGESYYLIEMHLRGGGSGLCTHMASFVSNTDMARLRINLLTGDVPKKVNDFKNRYSCTVFGDKEELNSLANKIKNKFYIDLKIQTFSNLKTKKFEDGRDREAGLFLFYLENQKEEICDFLLNNAEFENILIPKQKNK